MDSINAGVDIKKVKNKEKYDSLAQGEDVWIGLDDICFS